MNCELMTNVLEIMHNLSIVALLLTTFYFGQKQVNKKDLPVELLAVKAPENS